MSVKQKKPIDSLKMDRILTKTFYIVFQVLKVLFIKICKIQSLDLLFLVVFISFYISRYHFSQVFRTSFNIIWKKDFRHKFSFFNGFTQPHPRLLHYARKMLFANASKTIRNWFSTLQPDNYLQFTKVGTRKGMDEHLKLYNISEAI